MHDRNPTPESLQRHVLLVDDDRHILRAVTMRMKGAGYRVSTAADGQAGLQLALIETPDVLVIDLSMPKMTGLELIAELRRNMPEINHPIILLSASVSDHSRRELGRLGVSDVLEKPFEGAVLIEMVSQVIERRRAPDQIARKVR